MFTVQLQGVNQNTTVVCSATGGYPPITNISLLKTGNIITTTTSEPRIHVNVADIASNHFGLYTCLVNLSGVEIQECATERKRYTVVFEYSNT